VTAPSKRGKWLTEIVPGPLISTLMLALTAALPVAG
jgi:hypothetical protein